MRLSLLVCPLLLCLWLHTPALGGSGCDTTSGDQAARVKAFLGEELEFERYLFPPGPFPSVRWKRPAEVEATAGRFPLGVEFYDASGERVTRAEKPGRFGAVVRGRTADGFEIIRYVTLYCCEAYLDDYSPQVPVSMEPLPGFGVSELQWQAYRRSMRKFSFGSLLTFPVHDPDAAVFLAGLSELDSNASAWQTPRLIDRRWWIDFKRRHEGTVPPSLSPGRLTARAPVVQTDVKSSPYRPDDIGRIRGVCTAWADSSGVPMVALVLHNGKIVFHEAFATKSDGTPMSLSTPTWLASITKLLTGVLVMQFVDRGLVDLDAPLNRYLPELSSPGAPCPLTLRHCLTHTGDLSWAGEWASDWNPSMENQVAQALPFLAPGHSFKYHRAGYALAAKVIERISGETVPALFARMIFSPLGMEDSFADNTYGGLYGTAMDMGRFGQMLLNGGRYGDALVMSERAYRAFLPRPLRFGAVDLKRSWGIGSAPLGGNGLSDSTFGHEAASGALFRVDPAHGLVVVVGRDRTGLEYRQDERFLSRFLQSVVSPLKRSGLRD